MKLSLISSILGLLGSQTPQPKLPQAKRRPPARTLRSREQIAVLKKAAVMRRHRRAEKRKADWKKQQAGYYRAA